MGAYSVYYDRLIEKYKKKAVEATKAAIVRAYERYFQIYVLEMQKIFDEEISNFYSDYTPKYYSRNGGNSGRGAMYDLFSFEFGSDSVGKTLKVGFDSSVLSYRSDSRRGGGNGDGNYSLYDITFRRGWHGGAAKGFKHPHEGTPLWRVPYDKYHRWGGEAAQSESPLDNYHAKKNDFDKTVSQNVFDNLVNEEIGKIRISW